MTMPVVIAVVVAIVVAAAAVGLGFVVVVLVIGRFCSSRDAAISRKQVQGWRTAQATVAVPPSPRRLGKPANHRP